MAIAPGTAMRKEALRRDILRRADRLPSPPTMVVKLMHMAEDETVGAKDIEPYFRADQALTARLLRLVNSSFFGLRYRCSTIPQAIELLGFDTLRSILLSAFFSRLLPRALLAYGYGPGGLWKHSLGAATLAREIGKATGCPRMVAEELYVAGLLHDIGKIVLGEAATKPLSLIPNDPALAADVTSAERRTAGFDHTQVGRMVADRWKLSELTTAAIAGHHLPQLPSKEVAIVHLADQICVELRLGYIGSCEYPVRLADGALELIGISGADVKALVEKNMAMITEAGKLLART